MRKALFQTQSVKPVGATHFCRTAGIRAAVREAGRARSERHSHGTCLRLGRQCGVTGSNPHRFRGSFAHDCYLAGCSAEQVAAYLGDTVKTVYKHYTFFTKQLAKQADDKLLNGWSPAKSDAGAAC